MVNTLYQAIKVCSHSKETITQEGRVVSYLCLQQWGPFSPPQALYPLLTVYGAILQWQQWQIKVTGGYNLSACL